MKRVTKVLVAVAGVIGMALQSAAVQHAIGIFLQSHPNLAGGIGAIAAAAALAHDPKSGS
jgi:hypothetical protein